MALYLKYRPKNFSEVVGQQHITDILLAQAKQGKFSHNYLLYGPRGTGKTSSARLLAKMVNATTDDLSTDPAAALIDGGQTLDFVEIDAASHTGVDNIREEIIDKALYPPTQLKRKVYVIDEVHMLSKGAFNALLKIMEEPPPYLLFILATTEINKVPDTIVSRCQVFNFKRIGLDDISGWLAHIADHENIAYEPEGLRLLAKLSSGAMRDAIKYLEQVSMLGVVSAEHVAQFLGVVSDAVIQEFMQLLSAGDAEKTFAYVDQLYTGGTDLANFAKDVLLRLDEHFMEDPKTYTYISTMVRRIYSDIKRYPYPVLVYKSELWKYFNEGSATQHVAPVKTSPAPVVKKQAITQDTPSTEEQKQVSSQETPVEQAVAAPTAVVSGDDHAVLMEAIIAKVDKIMVKSVLKKNAIIKSVDDNLLTVIVINQQYYNSMQKTETVTYMQDILKQVTGKDMQIKRVYMTKEDYLQQALS